MTPRPSAEEQSLASLSEARQAVLRALRQEGDASAEQLAAILGITVSGARQHLAQLVARCLVEVRQVRGGPGRPKARYRLAPAAEGLFPKRYGDLTNELLEYAEAEHPALVEQLFERRRRRRVERAKVRLAGKPFEQRVAELARILDADGYLADFAPADDGAFRITEHNCAILDVARRWGQACTTEIAFLREALPDAEVNRVAHMIGGAHVCAYEVRPKPTAG
ncbi:MAG TPA: helix-turn-helix domain-containing protein [Chloroflexota bacterium]|nr:helix-turn-helix domain-containing protein [Chloroflexota bacterium]